jgi:hypothetical protein
MGRSLQGRTVFAAMLAAHAALFLLLTLALKPRTTLTRTEFAVAPVYLADLRRKARPKREPQAAPPAAAAPPIPTVLSRPAEAAGPAVPAAPEVPTDAASDGEAQQLARTLRGSRVGCANPDLLSEAEQLRCQDQLEAGSKLAKYIPTPLPPERRAYYDAVVKAKADMKKRAVVGEHGPAIGCKLAFGGPKGTGGWKKPANGLKLGPLPCYLMPPVGPLTATADITDPDTVIRDPKKVMDR